MMIVCWSPLAWASLAGRPNLASTAWRGKSTTPWPTEEIVWPEALAEAFTENLAVLAAVVLAAASSRRVLAEGPPPPQAAATAAARTAARRGPERRASRRASIAQAGSQPGAVPGKWERPRTRHDRTIGPV